MDISNSDLCAAMEMLGVSPSDFVEVKTAPSLQVAKRNLLLLQEKAKKNYRKAAKLLHPDVNGGDEEKTEAFKRLNAVVEDICNLELRSTQPRDEPVWQPVGYWTESAATTSTVYWPRGVIRIVWRY